MATFEFKSPDGQTYQVNGPEGSTPQQAFEVLQKQLGAQPSKPTSSIDKINAFTGGAVDLPIVGPAIQSGLQKVAGGIRSILPGGGSYADELKAVQDYANKTKTENPGTYLGGQLAGGTVALGGAGLTAAGGRILGTAGTLPQMMVRGGASNAAIGGADATVRGEDPSASAGLGGAIGAGAPLAMRVVGALAAPVVSNIRARWNPQGAATSQVARAVQESGRPVQDIVNDVSTAAREGQPMFTAADAMGNAGQNMLKTAASAPGPGRTNASNFLDARQAGQGRRVQNTIAEGLDAPITAQQAEQGLTTVRDNAANAAFPAARQNAGPVDLSGAIRTIDETLSPGATQIARPQSGLRSDTIESALEGVRSRLTDNRSMLTNYTAVERVRGDLADQVQMAVQRGQGNRARMLGQVLREIDNAMESASPGFRRANAQFAAHSRDIEAVGQGKTAAQRGRSEDVVRDFQGRLPPNQQPYRVGYADRLIENAQGAPGVNKARFVAPPEELAALSAPGRGPTMQRRLERENTMFDTRHKAFGGSRTAENLADNSAMTVDPSIVAMLLSGQIGRASRQTFAHASNALHGNTPAVRERIAELLLQRGHNPTFGRDIAAEIERAGGNSRLVQALARGASAGGTAGYSDQRNR